MEVWQIQNVIAGKSIKNPTPSFKPNVIKILVAAIGVEPDNYYSFGLFVEACGSHHGYSSVTVT